MSLSDGILFYVSSLSFVMPGLVPGIHVLLCSAPEGVDGRDKPGHDSDGYAKLAAYLSTCSFSFFSVSEVK
jgi:hypothetical protein